MRRFAVVPDASAPVDQVEPELPPLEVYIDPGGANEETIKDVLAALSEVNVAAGGLGLIFKEDGTFVVSVEEVVP